MCEVAGGVAEEGVFVAAVVAGLAGGVFPLYEGRLSGGTQSPSSEGAEGSEWKSRGVWALCVVSGRK